MVYIVAEIGCNHNGSVELAKKMVDEAKKCGVDAVKFQVFKAPELISKYAPKAAYQTITTGTQESQLEMTQKLELTFEEYLILRAYATEQGLDVFATPFDQQSLDFLIETGMHIYKIPSGEITNLPYLEKIGAQQKKVMLSTGMATLEEIQVAVSVLQKNGTQDITVLHCTTEYPAPHTSLNISVINTLKRTFPTLNIGYSDHSIGNEAAIAAVALGANVIEKHFTLDRAMSGPDHLASADPVMMASLVDAIRVTEKVMGSEHILVDSVEEKNKVVARKSIVARTAIQKGDVFTTENVTVKRPGNGISPMQWYQLLGQVAQRDFEQDEVIQDSRFENQV